MLRFDRRTINWKKIPPQEFGDHRVDPTAFSELRNAAGVRRADRGIRLFRTNRGSSHGRPQLCVHNTWNGESCSFGRFIPSDTKETKKRELNTFLAKLCPALGAVCGLHLCVTNM